MKTLLLLVLTIATTTSGIVVRAASTAEPIPSARSARVKRKIRAFRSERELARHFAALAEKHRLEEARRAAKERRKALREARRAAKTSGDTVVVTAAEAVALNSVEIISQSVTETVTNTQHAGVDEGGIVKVHGNHLVVLRRGRLFTIAINDGELKPISTSDAFGPDVDPKGSWYDEMLISENTVVVIGYSYQRGGTEVGLFDISSDGQLSYRSTYHLSSGDYYSSRNYASRLIGNKLIFYTPQYVNPYGEPIQSLPAVRKWHEGATESEFQRIVQATRVYRPLADFNLDNGMTFHTVTVCDLANRGFDCQGTTVLGPSGRVFYVSPDSVYVWASAGDRSRNSFLFRMPLDGSGPSALLVSGSPVDQFSFLQSEDQHLNVVVRSEAEGDGMWAAEVAEGDVALMRIPITSFSDGSESVPSYRYRPLQKPDGDTFQNRFVSNYLIYGTGSGWGDPNNVAQSSLFIVDWMGGNSYQLLLPHGVDRIEAMGSDAVVVGTDGKNLHFSSVRLGQSPDIVSQYVRAEASQGELRSHGFFYKPDGDNSGTVGLPISVPGRPGYIHLFENSAAILFLRNDALQFREVGELGSQPERVIDDECRASCVDWYGNARPLFLRGRVFALLGYELVEGTLNDGRIGELRRINYAPGKQYGVNR